MKRMAPRLLAGLVLAAAFAASAGCSEDPLTQLVVSVDTDLPSDAFDTIRVEVVSPSGTRSSATFPIDGSLRRLPATLSLVHAGGALDPVSLVVAATRGPDLVVVRAVRTGFVANQTRTIHVRLLGLCAGVTCDPMVSTCNDDGVCDGIDVPAASLPAWSGRVPPPLMPEPIPVRDAGPDPMDADAEPDPDLGPRDMGPDDDVLDLGPIDAGPVCEPRHAPPRPSVGASPEGFQRFFAVERLELGLSSTTAWREIGLDLDNRCTTAESEPEELECATRIRSGHPDGEAGVDNQFGASLLPAIADYDEDLLLDYNQSFRRGLYGLVFSVSGWNREMDDDAVQVAVLEATSGVGPTGGFPEFLGDDVWTISQDSLVGRDIERPLCSGSGWVTGGVVVGQLPSRCGFRITSENEHTVQVVLSRATVVIDIDEGSATFGQGSVAGRWRTADFINSFEYIGEGFCADAAGPVISAALNSAADVVSEGAADPMLACDAISFGASFAVGPAAIAATIGPSFTPRDWCP